MRPHNEGMSGDDCLQVADGPAVGSWIEPELTGDGGSVTGTVPSRFEAYVRILHPAANADGVTVSWKQVASETARAVHPLVQWDALVGANRYRNQPSPWPGSEPDTGSLQMPLLEALCRLLAGHTKATADCCFGVWTGHNWGSITSVPEGTQPPPKEPWRSTADLSYAFSAEELERPVLPLPPQAGRDYRILTGRLAAATEIPERLDADFLAITPNMIWPADRAWYVASEIDFDSTLVGGSAGLIDAILAAPEFEAFAVGPDDSLTWDADRINPLPLPPD